jgi:hypothetical protein
MKVERRRLAKREARLEQLCEHYFLDAAIDVAEDERTTIAKENTNDLKKNTIDFEHTKRIKPTPGFIQKGINMGLSIRATIKRAMRFIKADKKRVRFATTITVAEAEQDSATIMVTYDSGADDNYMSESDRANARLPILRKSSKRVNVANGGLSKATNVTPLPIPGLSKAAAEAHTFKDFPTSLLSVGKVNDDGNVSIFTRKGVSVHKEEDVLITVKGQPVMIGRRDERGRYRIPLVQQRGQWQPRIPTKRAKKALGQANSVYDLPSTEQAIKWMHAVCGYPVKSTWVKAIKAGNFVGWPLLTVKNVTKYYPDTVETQKGHMNQTRKNVRSTKPAGNTSKGGRKNKSRTTTSADAVSHVKAQKRGARGTSVSDANLVFEEPNVSQLKGKKIRDVYTRVYDVRNTVFSDQTGQFPTRSQRGNKYIMVMVEIDSNAILVEPLKSRKDPELTRAYRAMMLRLKRAGIIPKKHVLDNEVS